MNEYEKETILISFIKIKERYKKLAEYIINLIKNDPAFPKESLHTIIYRIKNEERLIKKIDDENQKINGTLNSIGEKNFKIRIGDLIGIRFVCLRLSDIDKVDEYLKFLVEEKILRLLDGPNMKRSFVLPIDPGETIPESIDLRYSGYSSIHYQVELGENSDATAELRGIQIEFQLRTILEEAWGEIDHKYRYALSRSGVQLPDYVHTGFYNLSAYLQVAAMQAEFLCRQVEAHSASITRKTKGKAVTPVGDESGLSIIEENDHSQTERLSQLQMLLEKNFGCQITDRTLTYIKKRLDKTWNIEKPQMHFKSVFTEEKIQAFKTIFRETLKREPFEDIKKRNVDVINAVNFVLFDKTKGTRVAQEGLKSVLKWRNP